MHWRTKVVRTIARLLFLFMDSAFDVHDARTRAAAEGFVDLLLEKSGPRLIPGPLPLRQLRTLCTTLFDILQEVAPLGFCEACDAPAELVGADDDGDPLGFCAKCFIELGKDGGPR